MIFLNICFNIFRGRKTDDYLTKLFNDSSKSDEINKDKPNLIKSQ